MMHEQLDMKPESIKESSRTLALPSPEKIQKLDELAHQYAGLLGPAEKPFHQSITLAMAMNELRTALTPDLMQPMLALMNSPLGFLTDRNGRPNHKGETKPLYDVAIVRDCLIEAILRGVMPINNEFNILAGRCYLAKNGLGRRVRQFPGLTEYKDGFTVPRISEGKGAVIACWATWKLNGVEDKIEREFAIKGDSYATADSYLGKAQRKLLNAVFERVSGEALPEGEVTDDDLTFAKDVTPKTKTVRTKPTFSSSEPQAEEPPAETAPPPVKPEPPEFVPETIQQQVALLAHKHKLTQPRFIAGLRLLKMPEVPDEAETCHELPDSVCRAVLGVNFEELVSKITEAEWNSEVIP
jgi:hypothetical protein